MIKREIRFYLFIYCIFYSIFSFAEFKVYDTTLYKNKPDLKEYNIESLPIIYENTFFSKNKSINLLPSESGIKKAVNIIEKSGSDIVILDIERWELRGSKPLVESSISKYRHVINSIRSRGVTSFIGYYGLPPVRDYWRAIANKNSPEFISWKQENDQIQQLVKDVDIFFPSLYTFYSDQQRWKKYAIAQISEARRLDSEKPVIVFLWPQYHNSNKILGRKYLSAEFWRLQLDTAKQYADGIVIWGGWKKKWDKNAPWWTETVQFMKDNKLAI